MARSSHDRRRAARNWARSSGSTWSGRRRPRRTRRPSGTSASGGRAGCSATMRFTMAQPEVSCHPETLLDGRAHRRLRRALLLRARPGGRRRARAGSRGMRGVTTTRSCASASTLLGRRLGGAYRVLVDANQHVDRAGAERSGVGFIGKNTMLITRTHGSWVVLGTLVTDVEIEPTPPLDAGCGSCTLCIDACPTGALDDEPGVLDATRCLSYWTQTAGQMPDDVMDALDDRVYGCDICQDVCPWNRGVEKRRADEPLPDGRRARWSRSRTGSSGDGERARRRRSSGSSCRGTTRAGSAERAGRARQRRRTSDAGSRRRTSTTPTPCCERRRSVRSARSPIGRPRKWGEAEATPHQPGCRASLGARRPRAAEPGRGARRARGRGRRRCPPRSGRALLALAIAAGAGHRADPHRPRARLAATRAGRRRRARRRRSRADAGRRLRCRPADRRGRPDTPAPGARESRRERAPPRLERHDRRRRARRSGRRRRRRRRAGSRPDGRRLRTRRERRRLERARPLGRADDRRGARRVARARRRSPARARGSGFLCRPLPPRAEPELRLERLGACADGTPHRRGLEHHGLAAVGEHLGEEPLLRLERDVRDGRLVGQPPCAALELPAGDRRRVPEQARRRGSAR